MSKKQEKPIEENQVENQVEETPKENPTETPAKEVTLVSGAEYWDFEANPAFVGLYDSLVKREQDEVNGTGKAGDLIGFNFLDADGEMHIISNSYAIEKALLMDYKGSKVLESGNVIKIIFLGKGENSKGQPFNRFKVSMMVD